MKLILYKDFYTASFATKSEAVEKVKEIETFINGRPYYLNHGEAARPEYRAQRYRDGWGIKVLYCYFKGTCHAPKDGRFTSGHRFFSNFF